MAELIRAICVDDNAHIRDLMAEALKLIEVDLIAAYASAEEFLEDKSTGVYEDADLFIFDVRLPNMSGLELAAKLRAEGEKRPIVAVSAWDPPREKLEACGVVFLRKPFALEELKDTLKTLA